jgi:hypothetical protein
VHRSALAAAQPLLAPVDLLHHGIGVAALGDAVAMATVSAGDAVLVREMHADADGGRLFARIEMDEARDLTGGKFEVQAFLEIADQAHRAIGAP